MARAGLDEHHFPFHDLPIRALELHGKGGCSVGRAAAPVSADTTELSSVGLHAGAARQLKLDGLGDFGGANALFAFLLDKSEYKMFRRQAFTQHTKLAS